MSKVRGRSSLSLRINGAVTIQSVSHTAQPPLCKLLPRCGRGVTSAALFSTMAPRIKGWNLAEFPFNPQPSGGGGWIPQRRVGTGRRLQIPVCVCVCVCVCVFSRLMCLQDYNCNTTDCWLTDSEMCSYCRFISFNFVTNELNLMFVSLYLYISCFFRYE